MKSSPRIVFTGITGLLGGYFLKGGDLNFEITGVSSKDFNISDKKKVLDFVNDLNPRIIVHAASAGNVDYCEKHPDEAYAVNVEGTRNIIEAAKKINAKIIFLSSNAIYDGDSAPYDEKKIPNPVDIYGKTKVEGEKLIIKSDLKYVILRLITMYGWPQKGGRQNPVTWMIDNLKREQRINVVNDIYNNHLWAGQAAEALWEVIRENISGVYNIAGADCISRYDLALKVAEVFGLDQSLISPVTSDFFKNIAKRPKNTCFNTSKMEKQLGIKPLSIIQGLNLMKKELESYS
ncbi:MAG: SDR family oxidoreductase [Patescibacteria group bacterium]